MESYLRRPPMTIVDLWQHFRKIERQPIIRCSSLEGTNLKGAGHVVKRWEVHAYVMCTGGAVRRGLRVRNACGQCVPQRHESASLFRIIIALENQVKSVPLAWKTAILTSLKFYAIWPYFSSVELLFAYVNLQWFVLYSESIRNNMCTLEETWLLSNFSSSLDIIEALHNVSIELNELFYGEECA